MSRATEETSIRAAAEALHAAGLGHARVCWCAVGDDPRTAFDVLLGMGAKASVTVYEHPDRAYVIEHCGLTLRGVRFEAQFSRPIEASELAAPISHEHHEAYTCRAVPR